MRDVLVGTVLRIYDQTSFLVTVSSVDLLSAKAYSTEEVIHLKLDDSFYFNNRFNRLIWLIGQQVLLLTDGKDEFGRIVARYKWIQAQ